LRSMTKTKKTKGPAPVYKVSWSPADALSKCAEDYAALTADPFHKEHHACMPIYPSLKSRKFTTWSSGTLNTGSGSGNFGYVVFNPWYAAVNSGGTSCIAKSASTYTGTVIALSGVGVDTAQSNSDYTTVVADQAQVRLVAAGLRVWYSGPINVLGGDLYVYTEEDHSSLQSASFASVASQTGSTRFVPTMGKRYGCVYTPVVPLDFAYMDLSRLTSQATAYMMGVVINGATTGATFSYEAYAHFEAIGAAVRGKSPSHADVVGAAAVQSLVTNAPQTGNFASTGPRNDELRALGFIEKVGEYVLKGVSGASRVISVVAPPLISSGLQLLSAGADVGADVLSKMHDPPRLGPMKAIEYHKQPTVSEMLTDGSWQELDYHPVQTA